VGGTSHDLLSINGGLGASEALTAMQKFGMNARDARSPWWKLYGSRESQWRWLAPLTKFPPSHGIRKVAFAKSHIHNFTLFCHYQL
jgi:hypothetical protein